MAGLKKSFALFAVVFCYLNAVVAALQSSLSAASDDAFPSLLDATLEELVVGLESRQFSSVDLVKAYIARINEVNSTLHMVTELNPDALSIAAALDDERTKGTIRGPLHGIPILIKNNIATQDKMGSTAGSYALLGATVSKDAGVAAKLRKAGAVILGKTNLSQWANFRSSNSSNGWSAQGGQVYGAYYQNQDPSGSSSGSGVASSLGLALASLGTETDGSILSPSEQNNLVGIKPSVGLTSRALVVPISQRQDTVGPMARTVKDAAYVLQAIAGKDPDDNYTSAIPFDTLPDYVAACNFSALLGKRIGILRNLITDNSSSPVVVAFEKAIQTVRAAGATIIDPLNITDDAINEYFNGNASGIVLDADFVADLPNLYLSKLSSNPQGVRDLPDVSNFTQNSPLEDYPDRDTAVWDESLALGFNNTSPEFWPYYQRNLQIAGPEGILGLIANNSLDAIMIPTDYSPDLPARLGTPVVTVPLGAYPANTTVVRTRRGLVAVAPNIPFGLSFIGVRWSEADLIGYAYAYEQRTMVRQRIQPYITPKTELADVVGQNVTMKL